MDKSVRAIERGNLLSVDFIIRIFLQSFLQSVEEKITKIVHFIAFYIFFVINTTELLNHDDYNGRNEVDTFEILYRC